MMISLRTGMTLERDELLRRLVEDRYERNDVACLLYTSCPTCLPRWRAWDLPSRPAV